jgi:hypothetical protein
MGDQYRQAAHELCPDKRGPNHDAQLRRYRITERHTARGNCQVQSGVEEIELADRMNEIVADYEKYLE